MVERVLAIVRRGEGGQRGEESQVRRSEDAPVQTNRTFERSTGMSRLEEKEGETVVRRLSTMRSKRKVRLTSGR